MAVREVTAYAGEVISDDAVGSLPWVNPENAEGAPVGDDAASVQGAGQSEYALARDFGLNLPLAAQPDVSRFTYNRRSGEPGPSSQAALLALEPDAAWGMGEPSGDMLDLVGSLDGTVTIGSGARAQAALNDGGDGSMEFGASLVTAAGAALADPWDGGGAISALIRADSRPQTNTRVLVLNDNTVARTLISLEDDTGGASRLSVLCSFSSTNGSWRTTDRPIVFGRAYAIFVLYNASSTANDPTIYLYDIADGTMDVLTVGDGLTETSTPSGTRNATSTPILRIGNVAGLDQSFDGIIDEVAVFDGAQPSPTEIADYCAVVRERSLASGTGAEDAALRLVVDGAIGGEDYSIPGEWQGDGYRDDETAEIDVSGVAVADLNASASGVAMSAQVDADRLALVRSVEWWLRYNIFADVTLIDPPGPDRVIQWPSHEFKVGVEVDGQPVTLNNIRYRIASDSEGASIVYDSGVIAGTVLEWRVTNGVPLIPWALPRDGEMYWINVSVIEDGGFDGLPIDGESGWIPFTIETGMVPPGDLTVTPITEDVS